MTLIESLRSDLGATGYTVASLNALWGPDAAAALHRGHRVPAVRAIETLRRDLDSPLPVAALAQLFVLGLPTAHTDLEAALPTLGVAGAVQLGLVSLDDTGSVRAVLDLRPYEFSDVRGDGAWWIASDLGELATGEALADDHVLGVGGATMTLTGLMFQSSAARVLDLGTGCGIQAMHASRFAEHVVATDISERALRIAAFNAALNGIESIEFRAGSLFEPVAGERFDRIVSNPPFVITPRADGVPLYEYRDAGMEGDALVEAVLTQVIDHLEPGGTAQLLGNWEYRTTGTAEQSGLARVQGWLDSVGLDHWVVEREMQGVTEYAETWIRDGGTKPGSPDFDRLYGAWLDDFADRGVTGVGFGYVLLRAPTAGPQTIRRTEAQHGSLGDTGRLGIGPHLEGCFEALDWLVTVSDEQLLSSHFAVAGDITEERHYWPGDDDPTAMTLRQGGGFARAITLDTALAALVGACDGQLSVGAIVGALAGLLEVAEPQLATDLVPAVRELVADGILVPAEPEV